MSDWVQGLVVGSLAVLLGNCGGDQATFYNCATKGKATMFSGGEIKCEVVRAKTATAEKGGEQ